MRKLIIASLIFLSACAHDTDIGLANPVKIPDLPLSLAIRADRLPDLTDPSMGAQQIDSTATDIKYNNVAFQVNNLIDLYQCVQKSINEKKDIKC